MIIQTEEGIGAHFLYLLSPSKSHPHPVSIIVLSALYPKKVGTVWVWPMGGMVRLLEGEGDDIYPLHFSTILLVVANYTPTYAPTYSSHQLQ